MKILLVGEGSGETTRFAELRRAQFQAALVDHEVTYVDARTVPSEARPVRGFDAVVSAGIYGPGRAALRLAGEAPLWIDLPGDPFADAQAYAWAAPGRVASTTADALATFLPQLRRGDQFSAVSGPSRYALLGALGALGRTTSTPPGEELVHVLPVAWSFGREERSPSPWGGGPLRLVLAGSLNTWFDVETTFLAIERAATVGPVEVDVLGGAVSGHHPEGEAWLRARIGGARARWRWHGWAPEAELAGILAGAHVGICLDRPGYEPELGSRTRVLFFLHQGLRVVATPRCELVRALAARGFVHPVAVGDDRACAALLPLAAAATLPDRAPLREELSLAATTTPLRRWAAAPTLPPGRLGRLHPVEA